MENFNTIISILAFLEIDTRILQDESDCVDTINKFSDCVNNNLRSFINPTYLPDLLESYKIVIDRHILGTSQTSTLPLRLMKFDSITSSIKDNIK